MSADTELILDQMGFYWAIIMVFICIVWCTILVALEDIKRRLPPAPEGKDTK